MPRPAAGRALPPLEQALGDKAFVPKDPATVPVPPELLDALQRAGRVLIAVHVQPPPDGDGVGSALGLARALRAWGKSVDICVDDVMPGFLRNLDFHNETRRASQLAGRSYDLAVLVDVADAHRIGGAARLLERSAAVAVIDHHQIEAPAPESVGAGRPLIAWIEARCDAASLQVAAVVSQLERRNAPLSRGQWGAVALPLLVGTYTDAGGFRHAGVHASSLALFKFLLQRRLDGDLEAVRDALRWELPPIGLALLQDPPTIPDDLQDPRTLDLLDKLRALLEADVRVKVERYDALGFGITSVPEAYVDVVVRAARLQEPEVNRNDVLRQIRRMHSLDLGHTVRLAVNLIEDTRGSPRVTCQFRSWDPGVALKIARSLGGGGHSRAAGVTLAGTLDEVKERVHRRVLEHVRREGGSDGLRH
ncbi:MAG: DHH family phosphoesterase [Myxococcales bacterium]|jgi:nanoRNase/pAp phosphatase (c-di-AMP/oligoRNAs hydrolase)